MADETPLSKRLLVHGWGEDATSIRVTKDWMADRADEVAELELELAEARYELKLYKEAPLAADNISLAESNAELRTKLAAAESHIAELTKPPEVEEWKKLIELAYADSGDSVLRIYRITAEYNRVRVQLASAEQERDAAKAALQPFVDYYLHRHNHRYAIKVGDFVAAIKVAMQAAKEEHRG